MKKTITIPRPHVPYGPRHIPKDEADADYLNDAAQKLENHYKPFGSNLRATVVKLLRDAAKQLHPDTAMRPKIVTICGSTRFRKEMTTLNKQQTLAGHIVLAPGVFAHDTDVITEAQKFELDELHLRKIDLADEILIVCPGSYIGESTQAEIAYAEQLRKPITYITVPKE